MWKIIRSINNVTDEYISVIPGHRFLAGFLGCVLGFPLAKILKFYFPNIPLLVEFIFAIFILSLPFFGLAFVLRTLGFGMKPVVCQLCGHVINRKKDFCGECGYFQENRD